MAALEVTQDWLLYSTDCYVIMFEVGRHCIESAMTSSAAKLKSDHTEKIEYCLNKALFYNLYTASVLITMILIARPLQIKLDRK